MRKRVFALLFLLAGGGQAAAADNTVTPYEFYATPVWTMYQQYWKHAYDACIANKNDLEGGQRLTIGRSISGDDFVMVHNMKSLYGEGETELAGKVWINGKTPYDFSGVKPTDAVSGNGETYVTIYLANGFIDQFAKANSVEIEFSKGRSKHSLKGSRDVIQRLNACADAGLARELAPPPPAPSPITTPLTWFAGSTSDGLRFIATQVNTAPAQFLAYVENGAGRYDLRIRPDQASISTRLDAAAAGATRAAANIVVNGANAFATLAIHHNGMTDVLDVPRADLLKLGTVGNLVIKALDPAAAPEVTVRPTPDASFGAAAMANAAPAAAAVPGVATAEQLAGPYFVRGRNPKGEYYFGSAEARVENGTLRVIWTWPGGRTDAGTVNMQQNVATAVMDGAAPGAIYVIGRDGTWRGTWDNGKATEVMVPKL